MGQPLADIGIISAYRFAADGSATKLDVTNLDAELADPRGCVELRRVGKGAQATCPPSRACSGMVGTLRFAHPTICGYFSTVNVNPA